MFNCGYRSQFMDGQRETFVRLEDTDSSFSEAVGMKRCGFNIEGVSCAPNTKKGSSLSFQSGMRKGSEGLISFGRTLKSGVTRAVFPEDLNVSDKMIFDPQDKSLVLWSRIFIISGIFAISIDPLFLYLLFFDYTSFCIGIDTELAVMATIIRTLNDMVYLVRIGLQFRTAYIAPSSRVFGRGELVIDPQQIAKRYVRRYFIADFLSVLPLPQIAVWKFKHQTQTPDVFATKQALLNIVFLQYIPRFVRFFPLTSELKKTTGVIAETAWIGAAYYLLWFMLAGHVVGALWYLLAIERQGACWKGACLGNRMVCRVAFLYCGSNNIPGYDRWRQMSGSILNSKCSVGEEEVPSPFNYGIYAQAISSGIIASKAFFSKLCYCLWWGLQNLSTLGQGLVTSTYPGENLFSIALSIFGLILFALLIGNMQTYLQSLTVRLEEMRIRRRDSEQWMHHRLLPPDLRTRVRRYNQYKWLETRGVDEENLVQNLPKDLRRDIKRHLCLKLVKRVPLFENMDERLLDAICERLRPRLYTEQTYIVREGDPVDEMHFIIRGRLESITTDGGRTGFFNLGMLKDGDFCGEELLTWALDPKSPPSLPSSTRTVRAVTEVEAFSLHAEELKFVSGQFRRLHSRQIQDTFRYYSQQWRTWAARFIQSAWRRHIRRSAADRSYKVDEVQVNTLTANRMRTAVLASRFARNALRGAHRVRELSSGSGFVPLLKPMKPSDPDFNMSEV